MQNFDIGIIGGGMAGVFATFKIAKQSKNIKTILFDIGKKQGKRRSQMYGFLGLFPSSDGKFYLNDVEQVSNLIGSKKAKSTKDFLFDYIKNYIPFEITKDRHPYVSLEKKIKKNGFEISLNDYIQFYPKDIHALSKGISEEILKNKNITLNFDNEVLNIEKDKNGFIIYNEYEKVFCKKILICVGRSGWRWAQKIYSNFGIIENNDYARFGIRIEILTPNLKELNKSSCTLKKNNLTIGPFCWNGTVIPEDHVDMAISAFRSNETRWKTDKVCFNFIADRYFENAGFYQTQRLAEMTFLLTNERISKEKVNSIFSSKSKISDISEYEWLKKDLLELKPIMPEILDIGYFHVPTIVPLASKIKLGNNLATEVKNMYCAGESCGITGLLSAAITGVVAGESLCEG